MELVIELTETIILLIINTIQALCIVQYRVIECTCVRERVCVCARVCVGVCACVQACICGVVSRDVLYFKT